MMLTVIVTVKTDVDGDGLCEMAVDWEIDWEAAKMLIKISNFQIKLAFKQKNLLCC